MLKIILAVCFLPLPLILFFCELPAAKLKNGLVLGVTLTGEQVSEPDVTEQLKIYRRALGFLTAFLLVAGLPPLWFRYDSTTSLYFMIWFLFAITLPFVPYAKGNKKLKALKEAEGWCADPDDEKWLWGIFYRNPDDSRLSIPKREGMGTTVNFAKPAGKVLMAFLILTLVSMPCLGGLLVKEEFTPVRLQIENNAVAAVHLSEEYRVPVSEIQSASLLLTLPKGSRTNGTAMTSVDKGHFNLQGIGNCLVCLDPRSSPYLLLKTKDGKSYLLGSADPLETKAAYSALQKAGL